MIKRLPYRSFILALALSTSGAALPFVAHAQASPLFAAYDETSTARVDTAPYSEFVNAITVSERGRTLVAYDIAHKQAQTFLTGYVNYLANIPVEQLNRDEQLAYWLNTRNILLIQGLSAERRVRSFKKKRGTPTDPGAFWTQKRITVSGTSLSLQDIEQDILLAGWNEPNVIFGLYQGYKGGPALPRQPFTGTNVNDQLAAAARAFTSDTSNLRVRGNKVRISTYFDWYLPSAYGGDETALREHLATLAKPDDQEKIKTVAELGRKSFSTDFEQYRTRQTSAGAGAGSGGGGGVSVPRGAGS